VVLGEGRKVSRRHVLQRRQGLLELPAWQKGMAEQLVAQSVTLEAPCNRHEDPIQDGPMGYTPRLEQLCSPHLPYKELKRALFYDQKVLYVLPDQADGLSLLHVEHA
jgi:hypothetical protein